MLSGSYGTDANQPERGFRAGKRRKLRQQIPENTGKSYRTGG